MLSSIDPTVTVIEDTFEGELASPLLPIIPTLPPVPLEDPQVTVIADTFSSESPAPELTPLAPRSMSDLKQSNWIPQLDKYWEELKTAESKKHSMQEFIDRVSNRVTQEDAMFDPTAKPVSTIQILKAVNYRTSTIAENKLPHGYCWGQVLLVFARTLTGKPLSDLYETYKALLLLSSATPSSKRQEIFFNLVCLEWAQRFFWFIKNSDGGFYSFRDIHIVLSKLTGLPITKLEASAPDIEITRDDFITLLKKLNPHRVMTLYSFDDPKDPGIHGIGIFTDKNENIFVVNGNFEDCIAQRFARKNWASAFDVVEKALYCKQKDAPSVDKFIATFDIAEGPAVVLKQAIVTPLAPASFLSPTRTKYRMLPTDEELNHPVNTARYKPTRRAVIP